MRTDHIDPALVNRAQMEQGDNPYITQRDLFLGKVVAVYPATGTVDVALDGTPSQGGFYRSVPVLSWSYATQTGETYLPGNITLAAPQTSAAGPYDQPIPSGEQDVWCVCGHLNGRTQRPVCLGFLSPLVSQVHTKDAGWKVSLHESGVWSAISQVGDVQVGLPDGSYILLSPGTSPVDMTTQNAAWKPATTSSAYTVTLHVGGNVTLNVTGNIALNATGNVYLGEASGGAAVARVGDSVNLTTGVISSGSTKVYSG